MGTERREIERDEKKSLRYLRLISSRGRTNSLKFVWSFHFLCSRNCSNIYMYFSRRRKEERNSDTRNDVPDVRLTPHD